MSDFNNQLERMKSLMTYGKIEETKAPSNHTLEYKATAADGLTYGIIKEQSKYYIKYANKGKECIAEAYQYIGGINNKKAYEYSSYANALKNFEMKMSSINEAHDAKVNIATLDPFRKETILAEASDKMKDEIARCRQIMYNASMLMNESTGIGATPFKTQPEAEHANSGDKDAPFTDEVTPDMEFEGTKEECPKCAGNPFDKGEKGEKAEAFKTVTVNEGLELGDDDLESDEIAGLKDTDAELADAEGDESAREAALSDIRQSMKDSGKSDEEIDAAIEALLTDSSALHEEVDAEEEPVDLEGEEGLTDEEEDFELEKDDEEPEELDTVEIETEDEPEEPEVADDEIGFEDAKEGVDETDPEAVKDEIERLLNVLVDLEGEKAEGNEEDDEEFGEDEEVEEKPEEDNLEELDENTRNYLNNIISEVSAEILAEDELHVFGQHPGYRKEPMEVTVDAEDGREIEDTDKPFGSEIGDGKPFEEKVTEITEAVFNHLKECGILKKK